MATDKCPVTPERVRKILSTFLCEETKKCQPNEEGQTKEGPTRASRDRSSLSGHKSLNPRSREAFLMRVETFSPLTWFAKPEGLSALVCAQYGWENTEIDMLQCVSCKAFLCGKLPSNTDRDAYKEACRKLKSSITLAHEKLCSWLTNPAPNWYMQVPHYDPEEVRRDFHHRYNTLKAVRETLPEINYAKLSDFGFDTYHCGKLTYTLDQSSDEDLKKAAALAVTGWSINETKVTLVCQHCRRQAGLWNFKCSGEKQTETVESDPPVKRQKLEAKDNFDPSEEHRTFCPWIILKQENRIGDVASSQSLPSSQSTNHSNGTSSSNSESPGVKSSQSSQTISSPGLNCSQDSNTSSDSLGSPDRLEQRPRMLPGWVRNLRIIAPTLLSDNTNSLSSTIKRSPMVDGLRSIRRLFRDWASPEVKNST